MRVLTVTLAIGLSGLANTAHAQPTASVTSGTGVLGAVITIDAAPATIGYALRDGDTSVEFVGTYTPPGGAATAPFTVTFAPGDVTVVSDTRATVIFGQGASMSGLNPASLRAGGTLNGTIRLITPCKPDFNGDGSLDIFDSLAFQSAFDAGDPSADYDGDGSLTVFDFLAFQNDFQDGCGGFPTIIEGPATLPVATDSARWRAIYYPDGPGGIEPPQTAELVDNIPIILAGGLTDPSLYDEPIIRGASGHHFQLELAIDENPTTAASAPLSLLCDIITFDALGNQVALLDDVLVAQVIPDGDPDRIIYRTNIAKPVVLIELAPDPALLSAFSILRGDAAGSVGVVVQ